MLQGDGVIGCEHDIDNGGYEVLMKTYKEDVI